MFSTLRNRINGNRKGAALVLTFALVITGSGLSSLASLSDTLHDTVTFNTLSVDLKDGTADTSSITFQNINPAVTSTFEQTINLTNSGSASATVTAAGVVSTGAGTDLDAAVRVGAFDATDIRFGVGGNRPYVAIADFGPDFGTITLNAGQSKTVVLRFVVNANPAMTQTSLVADLSWTATHP